MPRLQHRNTAPELGHHAMSTRAPRHRHHWLPAPELGADRFACVCGEFGWRNHARRIVTGFRAHPERLVIDDVVLDQTGFRRPSLDDYDAGRDW